MSRAIKVIKKDMIKAASRAYQIGLQTGNGGNLSCRIPGTDTIIIKGSGYSFGECTEDNFVTVNLEGEVLDGGGKPSVELVTHLCVYRNRPDIHAIFHTHSPWSTAYAQDSDEIPLLTGHSKAKLGPIPIIRVTEQAAAVFVEAVDSLLKDNSDLWAFIQSGHGIFSFGEDIIQAEHNAELIEETAQIALLIELRRGN